MKTVTNLNPYYKLVEEGYLNSQEKGNLVLFNYTDKCTYDRYWNEHTLSARGIIFNKISGECVARPFPKFFNLSELENKQLPQVPENESYEVCNKEDGSLGILRFDDQSNKWEISTRGSFTSQQAMKATEIWDKEECRRNFSNKEYTLLFEIIYPENRMNVGARLVTDYGTTETLILLAAINIKTGADMSRIELESLAEYLKLPIVKKCDYTINELIELKKTIPANDEGWVVKFNSGFRVKIKGDEYIKLHKIINSVNALSIWEKMKDSDNFCLSQEYLQSIPEEILPEVLEIQKKLLDNFNLVLNEVELDYNRFQLHLELAQSLTEGPVNRLKVLGLMCQNEKYGIKYPTCMFLREKGQNLTKVVAKIIRPCNNII